MSGGSQAFRPSDLRLSGCAHNTADATDGHAGALPRNPDPGVLPVVHVAKGGHPSGALS